MSDAIMWIVDKINEFILKPLIEAAKKVGHNYIGHNYIAPHRSRKKVGHSTSMWHLYVYVFVKSSKGGKPPKKVMECAVTAYIAMSYTVMAVLGVAYIVMAGIAMASIVVP